MRPSRSALPGGWRLRTSTILTLLVAVVTLQPAWAAPSVDDAEADLSETRADLADARERRAQVQRRLDAAAATLGRIEADVARIVDERDRLETRAAVLQRQMSSVNRRIAVRVRDLYKRGTPNPVMALASGDDPQAAVERAGLVQLLVEADVKDTEVAQNRRTEVEAVAERIREQEHRLALKLEEQREAATKIEADLAQARELEQELTAEERRDERALEAAREAEERRRREAAARAARRRAAASSSGGASAAPAATTTTVPSAAGYACPVARPHSFTNTWGAPRSGGRAHRGTDVLAPRGQEVIAITSGVWDVRPYGGSAGNWGILRGNDGNHYWYLHLQSHLVGDGAGVRVGQVIATNGDTGNARGTTPHVHFEYHPGGGGAINPYGLLRGLCG